MVHAESFKVSSLSNGHVPEENLGGDVLNNGRVTASTKMLKFKRRKVFAHRDFPPGCGTPAMRLKARMAENVNVVGGADDHHPSVPSSEANMNVANADDPCKEERKSEQRDEHHPRNDMELVVFESRGDKQEPEPKKEESGESTVYTSDRHVEPVAVKPLRICLPDGNDKNVVKSVSSEPKRTHGAVKRKATKSVAFHEPLKVPKKMNIDYGEGSKMKKNLYSRERGRSPDRGELPRQPRTLQVGLPPSRPSGSSGGGDSRTKVKETLRLFYGACRKLLQEEEAKPVKQKRFRVDCEAAKILKEKGKYLNTGKHIMGAVPGIEVGDEFQYRMELNILGIHKPSQGGIDYMKIGDEVFATSIVASGGYDDELDNTDVLTYTGQGGNVIKNKKGKEVPMPEDQKLVTGNLALANSVKKKNPVRVIRGNKKAVLESSGDKKGRSYVYDGLYVVETFWQETGSHGKLVFKFKLRRMPGQPELAWKVVKNTKKAEERVGLCRIDISEGHERLPICAVNEIDDEEPPSFIYTVKMIYPDWCRPIPPKGCRCTRRCAEAKDCACVAKNGGEIPYNYDGAIVSAKNLIYECGPLCKCPASCYLRVTQRGIKFPLEIFKTESRGWGVRSLSSIPSGSFICEYVGELLEDKEAERRTGNDEYLFDIGNRYDNSLAEGMSKLMPETQPAMGGDDDEMSGFTIDAAKKGNIGRFINHCCSPNLYAQNVLYDHEDTRIPHVMFFAMDNVPPLQELTYHYNYIIDQVRDSNGNIKKKTCYCGSSDCTGRLY
ncbi:histone-lysine N-methyltransferase, H3 lysine-9 specific SUVH6 isoform X1 [Brassica rapa]|uniref:histone-lysine N-methyltransferase, H3 lysine-9 specific SUVH6 isoform X1 n=1 Tax=Brassica campestris TaxID=3711 RepID=UPI0004F1B6A8|nr:histone-lysine N-methyltransferase, H3 lysine-9 specific SUVH6 isoform X1 [Brassica rapa]